MSWHAVGALDHAVDATRRFLFPFSLVRWAKLSLLVLLMGGGGAGVNASVSAVSDAGMTPPQGIDPGFGTVDGRLMIPAELAEVVDPRVLAVVAVGIVLLVAAISVASLSLRLVFYDALRTNEVRIWRPFLGRLRQSLGLFLFTAVLSTAAATPVALVVLVAVAADTPIGWAPVDSFATTLASLSVGSAVALSVLGAVFVAVATLALRFTYEFVVPTMIVEGTGVIGGWRRFWTTLRAEWTELLIYLLVHVVVSLGLSVVEGLAAVFVFALVATVAGLALLLVAVALGGLGALVGTTAGVSALAFVALAGIAVLVVLVLPVQVVTRSYRVAYEVSTLGGIDPALALLHADLDSGFDSDSGSDSGSDSEVGGRSGAKGDDYNDR